MTFNFMAIKDMEEFLNSQKSIMIRLVYYIEPSNIDTHKLLDANFKSN
jgi:hypothetical protein